MFRSLCFILFLGLCCRGLLRPALGSGVLEVTPEMEQAQDVEIARWFPVTHAKLLLRKEAVRVVVLGDRIASLAPPVGARAEDPELVWHWQWLEHLASRYHFTGGVRSASPTKRKLKAVSEAKERSQYDDAEEGPQPAEPLNYDTSGVPIMVENESRLSAPAAQALTALTTDALDHHPDLVILNYGLSELGQGGSLTSYRKALQAAVQFCQAKKLDVILAGPPLMLGPNERFSMGLTRALASVAAEVAAEEKVCFFDLGAAQVQLPVDATGARSTQGYDFLLPMLMQQYQHHGIVDLATPNAAAHRLMAEAAWEQMSGPAAPAPVVVQASFQLPVQPGGEGQLLLHFHSQSGAQDGLQETAIAALGFDRIWLPKLNAGAEASAITATNRVDDWQLRIPCTAQAPTGPYMMQRPDLPYGEEPFVRGSLLISEGKMLRLLDYQAPVTPLAASFPVGRLEGLTKILPLNVALTNASAETFTGTAEVRWRGETEHFPISLAAGKTTPVTLKLPLPDAEGAAAFKSLLTLRLVAAQATYAFSRELELAPDLLLDHPERQLHRRVALVNRARHQADVPAAAADALGVNFSCQADPSGLYVIFDLPPVDLNRKSAQPSARIALTIDARDATHRGTPGACEHLLLSVPWRDGKFGPDPVLTGLFGRGYDRELDARWFLGSVTTQSNNRRQVRLSIPRAYFYLHGWDLKGGKQSTLGINTLVQLIDFADDTAPGNYPLERSYSLVSPGLPRADAQSLGVLNLAAQSATWSARIY